MAFDFASFAGGLLAGALVGVLAGYLHETETTGELQERVRLAILQLERTVSRARHGQADNSASTQLHKQLLDLQDEIRRLYRRRDS